MRPSLFACCSQPGGAFGRGSAEQRGDGGAWRARQSLWEIQGGIWSCGACFVALLFTPVRRCTAAHHFPALWLLSFPVRLCHGRVFHRKAKELGILRCNWITPTPTATPSGAWEKILGLGKPQANAVDRELSSEITYCAGNGVVQWHNKL